MLIIILSAITVMQKHRIVQFIPYSYHIHKGWVEKISQTISDWLNNNPQFSCLNIASDIGISNPKDQQDTLYLPSFEIVQNFPIPKIRHKKFRQILNQIKKNKPDVIQTHTRFFVFSLLGWLVAKRLWCKRVHVEHGSGFVTGYPWYIRCIARLFDRTIGWWIFRQCDTIVTISHAHKKFIQKFTSKEPVVIDNPIDYVPKPKVKNKVPHIGFVGRLVSLKWVDILIQVLKKLENQAWTCTIVGEGDQRQKLQRLSVSLGLADRIRFVWADDRANRLHTFDIFVNPSYQEWLPTTVVEALLAWCIVVATDVGGTREISDKEDLIIVESGKIENVYIGLSQALIQLNKSWLSQKGVMIKFDIVEVIKKYKEMFCRKQ